MANYFKDRVVQFPGRVTMTPVSGQPNTYDMARAEGTVTEEGTPFNADTFNDIANTIHAFGTCTSTASAPTKVVTCPGFVLHEGAKISVHFENTNTDSTPRLNVNGTGEKYIATAIGDGTVANRSRMWSDNEVVDFVYAGDFWVIVNPALTNYEMRLLESRLTGIPTDQTRLYGILSAILDRCTLDYIVEQGETSGWLWRKWNSGRYEAERAWNVGQVTIYNSASTGVRASAAFNVEQPPHTLVSGDIEVTVLGNTSNSGIWAEKASSSTVRLCKAMNGESLVIQGIVLGLRVIAGKWK